MKGKNRLAGKKAGKGLFIVFEGIDGSGKSTQVERLARRLRRRGLEVVTLREPTQGKWGKKIREPRTSGSVTPEEGNRPFYQGPQRKRGQKHPAGPGGRKDSNP